MPNLKKIQVTEMHGNVLATDEAEQPATGRKYMENSRKY